MEAGTDAVKPLRLFYSYSHRDEEFRQTLETHLSFLRRGELIAEWHDRMIGAGSDWKGDIDRNLTSADIVLLLVSADFIASDYCWSEEMTKALRRHEAGEARVVPVILRPCRWLSTPLAKVQAVPRDGKAVTDWLNRDAAFDDVAAAIERMIQELWQDRQRAAEEARRHAESERQQAEAAARAAEEQRQRQEQEEQQRREEEQRRRQEEDHQRRAEEERERREREEAEARRKAKGTPVKLFYSYSHRDEELRNELAEHLFPLQRAGLIEVWHDREMLAGDTVDEEIAGKLRSADLVLVLVSPSFIRSEYCYDKELQNAIERHQRGEARVVPIVLRPCQWQLTPLKDLLAMPTDGRAVTAWPDKDQALNNVAEAIAKLARTMRQKGSRAADPAAAGAKPASLSEWAVGPSTPSAPPHPDPLPQAGEGDARQDPRPLAGEGGARDSGRVRAQPKNGVYIGVDPRELPDLAVFKDADAPWCPEMVVIPAGSFLMGSPESEEGRISNEGPQHWVAVKYRFAIGRYAVTFDEYDHFCIKTNREKPGDGGAGRGRRPVINVSWHDAEAYCVWLSKVTGRRYRLPSEAEWEYACRAGTTTRYAFGDDISPSDAAIAPGLFALLVRGFTSPKTTEVGRYRPNPWGVYDMHGNVWEWVEDAYHKTYDGVPTDGSAWTDAPEGKSRVLRGGSWYYNLDSARSASRSRYDPHGRYDGLGFRVVCVSPSSGH